eukprot:1517010-Prymnesium_polylepis.1
MGAPAAVAMVAQRESTHARARASGRRDSNNQAIEQSRNRAIEASSHQAIKPSSHQAIKPSSH